MKLSALTSGDRPREKVLSCGAAAVTTSELLAIILRTGTSTRNVLELAMDLFKSAGESLSVLSDMAVEDMCGIPGIGPDKAVSIIACLELGRRFAGETSRFVKESITDSEMVFKIMGPRLKGLTHEECWALWLNRANYIISKERLASGSSSSVAADIKAIIKRGVELKADHLILVHNHPSGNPRPGKSDLEFTRQLRSALPTFDLHLTDHIIICDDCFYSFDAQVVRTL